MGVNERPPVLEIRDVTKTFGAFTAVDSVSLTLRAGEQHALLGENGAGKSTLVKMIYGVLEPTAGELLWEGRPVAIAAPAEARALGIGMVFQHFSVFDALTVAENVALALPSEPMARLSARIAEISGRYGLALDPGRAMHTLSVGEKQRVEIVRALLQDPKLLILDEPTSVLTPQEAEALFGVLDRLAAEGRAILYISHRLEEVRRLCDAATILRRGKVVGAVDPKTESARSLAEMMVGGAVDWVERGAPASLGPVRLRLDHLQLPPEDAFAMPLADMSLSVHGGEIIGVAGVAGEGQSELFSALSGEALAPRAEMVLIDGEPMGRAGPSRRRRLGAAFAPEERHGHAAVTDMDLPENVVLSHHAAEEVARGRLFGGWIDRVRAIEWTRRVADAFDVRSGGDKPKAGSLSGGNLQKFVIGREILRNPGVLVVNQPTWGVDAGAASVIRRALIDLARSGAALVVISQDLDEVFEIADRIAVLHKGRLSAPIPVAEATRERIGLLMGGAHPERGEVAA
jgi:ABC-type uncharacterized transport system ATPase subunit